MDLRIEKGFNLNERRNNLTEDNVHILESVKDILTIDKTDLITVQMCADYYEVGVEAINSLIKNNKEELINNGLKLYNKKDFLKVFKGHLRNNIQMNGKSILEFENGFELIFPNRGLYFINKRTLLNIGMLLRDSEIAKELRRRILDIVHDSENSNESIETIINEIDEETKLSMELGIAMVQGDLVKAIEINSKINELKNKRIQELEKENKHKGDVIEGLADEITLAEKRQRLNQIIRINGVANIKDRWNLLYSEFGKKYHIDLDKRMDNLVYKEKVINNEGYEVKVTKKIKENKLEYIDKILNQLSDLYELSVKLFEVDVDKLVNDIKNIVNNN